MVLLLACVWKLLNTYVAYIYTVPIYYNCLTSWEYIRFSWAHCKSKFCIVSMPCEHLPKKMLFYDTTAIKLNIWGIFTNSTKEYHGQMIAWWFENKIVKEQPKYSCGYLANLEKYFRFNRIHIFIQSIY